jgi:hypothetical protein
MVSSGRRRFPPGSDLPNYCHAAGSFHSHQPIGEMSQPSARRALLCPLQTRKTKRSALLLSLPRTGEGYCSAKSAVDNGLCVRVVGGLRPRLRPVSSRLTHGAIARGVRHGGSLAHAVPPLACPLHARRQEPPRGQARRKPAGVGAVALRRARNDGAEYAPSCGGCPDNTHTRTVPPASPTVAHGLLGA